MKILCTMTIYIFYSLNTILFLDFCKLLKKITLDVIKTKGGFIIILSPFRDNRKPFIFLWKFTLRNAGIGLGSNPAFHTLKNE